MAFNEPTTKTPPQVTEGTDAEAERPKWPGWPGDIVYRLIVPVIKVGSIIGRKGECIKKLCEETGARVRVLDGPITSSHRIVLISGKEEPEAVLSPAMAAVMRISKRINGLPEGDEDDVESSGVAVCVVRLLVASAQAINLIGKQGATINAIQESSGATIRVLSSDDIPTDERVLELQGDAVKVIKALESVVGHLRKFLVDHSVLPLFEKRHISQDRQVENWADKTKLHPTMQAGMGSNDYSLLGTREMLYIDRERNQDFLPSLSGLSYYGKGTGLSGISSSGRGLITQVTQTMQIPLTYANAIIGVGGSNIGYIRRSSGAVLTVQESMGLPDEITLEIKGTSSEVRAAQQLIQECINMQKEVIPRSYGNTGPDSRSSYSQLENSFPQTSYGSQQYGLQYPYRSSGVGGYSSYRM